MSAAALLPFSANGATTVILAGASTFVRSDTPAVNSDTNASMLVGNNSGTGADFHGLLSFDLSAISAGSIINSITLTLYSNGDSTSGASAIQVDLLALTRSFVSSEATWNNSSTGNAWGTGGGDYSATILSSLSFSPKVIATKTFATGEQFVSVVQSALNTSRTLDLFLRLDDESGTTRNLFFFASDLDAMQSHRPSLTIDFVSSAVPEPSSFAIFAGFGAIVIVCARRRLSRSV